MGACRGTADEALAELIETDGRTRLRDGESLSLTDYLAALPALREMPVAMDAAIDMALRSRSRASRPSPEAVASLIADHPDLESKIREAALLGQALWSTNQTAYVTSRFVAKLPCEFGQRLPDGSAPYRLLRRLGAGASGEVLLAEDLRLSEPETPAFVAIKALAAAPDDPWSRRRLVDEAAKARRVDHPNVVRALHTGVSEQGDDYIVYEHVLGVDLETWAGGRGLPLEPRVAASIMERVSRAVQAAHTAGLTHCDLKPANILMTEDGEPKVTDFGAAVRWKQGEALRGESGRVGTLAFMAPEQYRLEDGARALHRRTCTRWAGCCTGSSPGSCPTAPRRRRSGSRTTSGSAGGMLRVPRACAARWTPISTRSVAARWRLVRAIARRRRAPWPTTSAHG